MDDLIPDFIDETVHNLHQLDVDLLALAQDPQNTDLISSSFRHLHTIKGNCSFVNLPRLQKIAHQGEAVIACFRDRSLAVSPARIGLLLEAADRMRLLLSHVAAHYDEPEGDDADLLEQLSALRAGHEPESADLPLAAAPAQKPKDGPQSMAQIWARLPYIVRSLSSELNKKIEIVMTGENIQIESAMLDLIKAPLTQMIRNSGDHGIEPPADRIRLGKPETGTIRVHAAQTGDFITMQVADDGQGLNLERIRAKALERGLASREDLEAMPADQLHQFIFNAGFSTAIGVSMISGRGVGMDIVRSNIQELGGSIELHSIEGQGSTFNIRIPVRPQAAMQVKS